MNDDDIIIQKVPTQDNTDDINEDNTNTERVFDISADNISPVTDDLPVFEPKKPIQVAKQPARPYIPPDADLLDKKIGTFDMTPFAPAKNVPSDASISKTPIPQPFIKQPVVLVPAKPSSIPLQDIPTSFNKIQKIQGRTLQDEVISALPPNLRPKKPESPPTSQPDTTQQTTLNRPNISSVPQKVPQAQQDGHFITDTAKPIRTYEGDVAEVMSHKRTSSASIAIAESKKQEGEEKLSNEEPSHAGRKMTMVLISILLLGGGAIGAYYLYSISPLAPVTQTTPQQKSAPSIIPSDTQAVLVIDSQNPLATKSLIQNEILKTQVPNTIKEIITTTKNSSGALVRVSGPDMINILDISAPDILVRSINPNWMLGVYTDTENNKNIFVVVTSNFFQNTFAGMLQWENVMADDLKQYLYPVEPAGISNTSTQKEEIPLQINPLDNLDSILPTIMGSSTATITATTTKTQTNTKKQATSTPKTTVPAKNSSKIATTTTKTQLSTTTQEVTPPLRPYFTLRGKFEDKIVKNKDVREFRTDTGTTLFLYSFIDSNHLVITSNEATLTEILTRLEKQSFIR